MSSFSKKIIAFLEVNGEKKEVVISPDQTLLTTLRENLYLTGAKPGCLNGDCGACTILVDQLPIKSCIMLTLEAISHSIKTIEGLHDAPIQQAFIEQFAFQCGYCTPGFIMNGHALCTKHPNATDEQIREWLSSNICRCTCYEEIEKAVKSVLNKKIDE
ncbi:(2Fe-2S)-binding protein [Niallia sp. 01092]|uniref:(2Fe-2S)-binding protein n=1 Tax=unclassified Niallia TaxID=2837522 RepID=UPI003FD63FD2